MAERAQRKTRTGVVVSSKMQKTVIVRVNRQVMHAKYGRAVRTSTRLVAHDQESKCGVGDLVRIAETRPMSKTKRWRVVEIVTKAV
jgi:small subunit ribosomal protein S17